MITCRKDYEQLLIIISTKLQTTIFIIEEVKKLIYLLPNLQTMSFNQSHYVQ